MGKIKIIKELYINGFKINSKTTFKDIENESSEWTPLWRAWELYQNNAYPAHFGKELERYEGKQDLKLIISNHKRWDKEKREHPEWFNVL